MRPNADCGPRHGVAVVGAGWSGLACALELSRRGHAVALYDAAPEAGGRARSVAVELGDRSYLLDNGQHLLVGAYRETLRLMREAGVAADALLRQRFEICYPDGFRLRAAPLPAPWHLLGALITAPGLSWAACRQAISLVVRWRRQRWQAPTGGAASDLFRGAAPELVRRLWRPLCLAALNAEPEAASAQVLLNVLRDTLADAADASDLLIPRCDLSQAFVGPALRTLRSRGVDVHLRTPVQRLVRAAHYWQIDSRGRNFAAAAVVLALPPRRAADLLATAGQESLAGPIADLRAIAAAPIGTVYLRYPSSTRLPRPVTALLDDAALNRPGQWVFDRGHLDPAQAGVFSVVISAATAALSAPATDVVAAAAAQLRSDLGLPPPLAGALILEKRATIVPAPGLRRPGAELPAPDLYLAGDAAAGDYPSTLEGSVRAGLLAAQALHARTGAAP